MIPRVTTVEAAAVPPVVPPVAPVEPAEPAELAAPFCAPEVFDAAAPPPLEAAPDALSPEGGSRTSSINTFKKLSLQMLRSQPYAFSSS